MSGQAVFLDKDGTLIHDVPYNVDVDRIELAPGAAAGVRMLDAAGYRLFIVSNQPGLALGYFAESALKAVEQRLQDLFAELDVPLAGFFYCPHHPQGTVAAYRRACDCRKPNSGMLLEAARRHQLDLSQCWMVGDILHDIEAGARAGCRTVLIDNGNETEWEWSPWRIPSYFARDLADAAQRIVLESKLVKNCQAPLVCP